MKLNRKVSVKLITAEILLTVSSWTLLDVVTTKVILQFRVQLKLIHKFLKGKYKRPTIPIKENQKSDFFVIVLVLFIKIKADTKNKQRNPWNGKVPWNLEEM